MVTLGKPNAYIISEVSPEKKLSRAVKLSMCKVILLIIYIHSTTSKNFEQSRAVLLLLFREHPAILTNLLYGHKILPTFI